MPDDAREHGDIDYRRLFEGGPHPYMVLRPDPAFTIAAVNDAYTAATLTRRADVVGRDLFEVFPDNPGDATADGVGDLRASLLRVLRDRVPDTMGVQKYDIPSDDQGGFTVKYWTPVNTPVFDDRGEIALIPIPFRGIFHNSVDGTRWQRGLFVEGVVMEVLL